MADSNEYKHKHACSQALVALSAWVPSLLCTCLQAVLFALLACIPRNHKTMGFMLVSSFMPLSSAMCLSTAVAVSTPTREVVWGSAHLCVYTPPRVASRACFSPPAELAKCQPPDMSGWYQNPAEDARQDRISHLLTKGLRHGSHGLAGRMDPKGWILVSELKQLRAYRDVGLELADVQSLLQRRGKQRLELLCESGDEWYIRVKQGWSKDSGVDPASALDTSAPEDLPEVLLHATWPDHVESIMQLGLLCGSD